MEFSITHTFNVTPSQYMDQYLDPHFEQYLVEHSSLKKRTILTSQLEGTLLNREIEICSGVQLPAALSKVVGSSDLCYIEKSQIDLQTYDISWSIEPTHFHKKIIASGNTMIKTLEGGQSERITTGTITVKIPLIGKIAEKFIIDSVQNTYQETARLFEKFRQKQDSGS